MRYSIKSGGFITLFSILVITAIAVSIVIGILLTGVSVGKISLDTASALYARSFATACAEDALEGIRDAGIGLTPEVDDDDFSGGLTFTDIGVAASACTFDVDDDGGEFRTISAVGTSGVYTRRIEVVVETIRPGIILESWEEVAS